MKTSISGKNIDHCTVLYSTRNCEVGHSRTSSPAAAADGLSSHRTVLRAVTWGIAGPAASPITHLDPRVVVGHGEGLTRRGRGNAGNTMGWCRGIHLSPCVGCPLVSGVTTLYQGSYMFRRLRAVTIRNLDFMVSLSNHGARDRSAMIVETRSRALLLGAEQSVGNRPEQDGQLPELRYSTHA